MAIINLMVPIALYIIQQAPNRDWLNLPNNMLQTPLHLAVMTRLPQVVKALIDGGADIEARDSKGDTPLHIACREGFDDIAQILLNSTNQNVSQDLEARNYDGMHFTSKMYIIFVYDILNISVVGLSLLFLNCCTIIRNFTFFRANLFALISGKHPSSHHSFIGAVRSRPQYTGETSRCQFLMKQKSSYQPMKFALPFV